MSKFVRLSKLKLPPFFGQWILQSKSSGTSSVFEGDAKACFDPLSSLDLPPDWTINTIINDIHNLARSFSCCNFFGLGEVVMQQLMLLPNLVYFLVLYCILIRVIFLRSSSLFVKMITLFVLFLEFQYHCRLSTTKKKKNWSYLTVMEYKTDKNAQDIYNVYEL